MVRLRPRERPDDRGFGRRAKLAGSGVILRRSADSSRQFSGFLARRDPAPGDWGLMRTNGLFLGEAAAPVAEGTRKEGGRKASLFCNWCDTDRFPAGAENDRRWRAKSPPLRS